MQNENFMSYKTDTEIPAYLPLPRFLVSLDLSNDAKLLYTLLFDRAGISKENGYIEADVYSGGSEEKTSQEPPSSNPRFSRAGAVRLNRAPQAGAWQASGHYTEYHNSTEQRRAGGMSDGKDLYKATQCLKPETVERMMQHFKDGAFEFELDTEGHIAVEGNTVYHVIPHFAEEGSESIVNKLRRIMARNLEKTE